MKIKKKRDTHRGLKCQMVRTPLLLSLIIVCVIINSITYFTLDQVIFFYIKSSNSSTNCPNNSNAESIGAGLLISTPASFKSSIGSRELPPVKNFI